MPTIISANTISNPVWGDANNTSIVCDVIFNYDDGTQTDLWSFGAHPDDIMPYSKDIFDKAKEMNPAPYVPPKPIVPTQISDRQFAIEARNRGFITQAEALAFVSNGTIPTVLLAVLQQLPQKEQDDAMITLAGTPFFERYSPLAIFIGSMFAASTNTDANTYLDDFFIQAGSI